MIEGPQYPFSVIQFALSQTFNIGIKPTTWFYAIWKDICEIYLEHIHFDQIWVISMNALWRGETKNIKNIQTCFLFLFSSMISLQCSVNQVHKPGSVNLVQRIATKTAERRDQRCLRSGTNGLDGKQLVWRITVKGIFAILNGFLDFWFRLLSYDFL